MEVGGQFYVAPTILLGIETLLSTGWVARGPRAGMNALMNLINSNILLNDIRPWFGV
jgi:hypothetical protein